MMRPQLHPAVCAFYDTRSLEDAYATHLQRCRSIHVTQATFDLLTAGFAAIPVSAIRQLTWPGQTTEIVIDDADWDAGDGNLRQSRLRSFSFSRVEPTSDELTRGVCAQVVFFERHELAFTQQLRPTPVHIASILSIYEGGELECLDYPHVQRSHPDFALMLDLLDDRSAERRDIDKWHRLSLLGATISLVWMLSNKCFELTPTMDPEAPVNRQQRRAETFFDRPHFLGSPSDESFVALQDAAAKFAEAAGQVVHFAAREAVA